MLKLLSRCLLHKALFFFGLGCASAGVLAASPAAPQTATQLSSEYTGGKTTVFTSGKNAFSFPFANLTNSGRRRFAIGNSFFRRNWVQAPASTTARDGLGPHFIARSCAACHMHDGRGQPPQVDSKTGQLEPALALLLRMSVRDATTPTLIKPEPVYGGQLANAAINGVKPEGQIRITYTTIVGSFADGTEYRLRKPHYQVTDLGYGPMHENVMLSPRIAPQLAGVGLIEAIEDIQIELNALNQQQAGGVVSGRVHRVQEAYSGETRVGRFGWKAGVASLIHQTAAAFNNDIGITSSYSPQEACTQAQADCQEVITRLREGIDASADTRFDIDFRTLREVVFYQASLAPVGRRDSNDPQVVRGEELFHQSGCAVCHRPSYVTAEAPFPELSSIQSAEQTIWPYTDLLLHDMGLELADGRPEHQALGVEWKTPPLWGIGMIPEVNGHIRLLHDGRADGVLEAILWHGGEAEYAKQQVLKLPSVDRQALVRFVESL